MNRRGFIASLAAGAAAVSLLGRLTAKTATTPDLRAGGINGMPALGFGDSFNAIYSAEDYDYNNGIWPALVDPWHRDSPLTDKDVEEVNRYLSEKWGI